MKKGTWKLHISEGSQTVRLYWYESGTGYAVRPMGRDRLRAVRLFVPAGVEAARRGWVKEAAWWLRKARNCGMRRHQVKPLLLAIKQARKAGGGA